MTAAVAVAAASCGGTRLVGGSGGGPGTGGAPCTAATGCLNGSGGSPGGDGGRGTGGVNVALCDQLQSEYAAALPGALACTPGAPISVKRWWRSPLGSKSVPPVVNT